MTLSIAWVETHRDLFALKDEWEALQDRSASDSLFVSWTWMATYWAFWQHTQQAEPWILTLRDPADNRLVAIAPMKLVSHQPNAKLNLAWKQLMFVSANFPVDHWDFIIERGYEEQAVRQILDTAMAQRGRWDVLELANILPDSPNVPHIRGYAGIPWEETDGHETPYLPLPADWDTFEAGLSKRKRKNVRRRHNLLEKTYGENWSCRAIDDPRLVEPTLHQLMHLHQTKWEAMGEPGAFYDPFTNEFYFTIARRFFDRGWIRLFHLVYGGETAGIGWTFAYKGRYYGFSQGLNDDLLAYNPGNILQEMELRAAIDDGMREYDFMWGSEEYKYKWGATHRVDRIFTYYDTPRAKLIRNVIDLAREARSRVEGFLRDGAQRESLPEDEDDNAPVGKPV